FRFLVLSASLPTCRRCVSICRRTACQRVRNPRCITRRPNREKSAPMFLSVFDLFKIGIGPSSSHTMGPMTAAARFLDELLEGDWPRPSVAIVDRLAVSLHGSLAFTGIG